MSAKVLAIGLDSADKDLLLQWSDSGVLPNIQRLRQRGLWAMVTSPPGLGDDATWATFYTGVSPARHGRFFTHQVLPGSTRPVWFGDTRLKQEAFWEGLSREGRKVGIFDVPKCTLSENIKGLHLVDWLVHGAVHQQMGSWPPSLASDVNSRFGKRPGSLCTYTTLGPNRFHEYVNRLLMTIEMKTALLTDYLDQDDWDLFLAVFKESHCVGHHCWHLHDPSHPEYDPEAASALGNPVKQVYVALDAAIGRLLDKVDSETTVMVFSDLGMGPNYTGNVLLEEAIKRLEGFSIQSGKKTLGRLRSLWRKLPISLRRPAFRKMSGVNQAMTNLEGSLPSYYTLPHNEISGAIRLNVVGREPHGRIHLGEEYTAVCEKLTEDLMSLVCLETGAPIVSKVLRVRDIFSGPFIDYFPDLLVIWNRKRPISNAWSPQYGEIKVDLPPIRQGNHLPDGVLFASGPAIAADQSIGLVSLMDLSATIAKRLGVALPNLDGVPIPEICE